MFRGTLSLLLVRLYSAGCNLLLGEGFGSLQVQRGAEESYHDGLGSLLVPYVCGQEEGSGSDRKDSGKDGRAVHRTLQATSQGLGFLRDLRLRATSAKDLGNHEANRSRGPPTGSGLSWRQEFRLAKKMDGRRVYKNRYIKSAVAKIGLQEDKTVLGRSLPGMRTLQGEAARVCCDLSVAGFCVSMEFSGQQQLVENGKLWCHIWLGPGAGDDGLDTCIVNWRTEVNNDIGYFVGTGSTEISTGPGGIERLGLRLAEEVVGVPLYLQRLYIRALK